MARAGSAAATAAVLVTLMAAAALPPPTHGARRYPEDVLPWDLATRGGTVGWALVVSESAAPAGAPFGLDVKFVEVEVADPVPDAAAPAQKPPPPPPPSSGAGGLSISSAQRAGPLIQ